MFKCMLTKAGRISKRGHISRPGERMTRVVVERRERTYATVRADDIITTKGWEIVREVPACGEHVKGAGLEEAR